MKLILVRHGATEWSVSRRHTGRTDLPLTTGGRLQADGIRQRVVQIVGNDAAIVYASPLERARQTAEIVMRAAPDELDERLLEYDYGDYEGLTTEEIRVTNPGWTVFDGCPGGESVADVEVRMDSFLADARASGTPAAIVFSHAHALRILAARALGQPGRFAIHLAMDTGSVSTISDERDGPAITLWNYF